MKLQYLGTDKHGFEYYLANDNYVYQYKNGGGSK